MPTLDSTDLQQIARITRGYNHVYFVSTTGNDGQDGLSIDTACATLAQVCTMANPGDLIVMLPGTYNEISGVACNASALVGAGMQSTVINIPAYPGINFTSGAMISELTLSAPTGAYSALSFATDGRVRNIRVIAGVSGLAAWGNLEISNCQIMVGGSVAGTLVGITCNGPGGVRVRETGVVVNGGRVAGTSATAAIFNTVDATLERCAFIATGCDTTNTALNQLTSGTITLVDCIVATDSIAGGPAVDLLIDSACTGTVSYLNSVLDPAKSIGTAPALMTVDVNAATLARSSISIDTPSGGINARVVAFAPGLTLPGSGTGGGSGTVAVDQNTGGADTLRVMAAGVGVAGANVRVYLASDYTTNPATALLQGYSTTGPDGRWLTPIYLTTGFTYTIVADKPGVFTPQSADVTV